MFSRFVLLFDQKPQLKLPRTPLNNLFLAKLNSMQAYKQQTNISKTLQLCEPGPNNFPQYMELFHMHDSGSGFICTTV